MLEVITLFASALLGFVTIEAIYISKSIRLDASPDKFSLRYYFSRPRNLVMLISNGAGTAWLVLAHKTVMNYANSLLAAIPGVDPVDMSNWTPAFTGGLIGLCGSFVVRVITKWMWGKAPMQKDGE